MEIVRYLSIAEFAKAAGVSKQAVYKQINSEKSQLTPYLHRQGKKVSIHFSALADLYGVEYENTTDLTPEVEEIATDTTQEVEEKTTNTTFSTPENSTLPTYSTPENQQISTDYIDFLKGEIAELKAQKEQTEQRLTATIQEKDQIIKSQADQLADLAQKVAAIANNAIMTTSQQQYLTAAEKIDANPPEVIEEKRGLFKRLFR